MWSLPVLSDRVVTLTALCAADGSYGRRAPSSGQEENVSELDFPMDKLTPEMRAVNLARMRDYLRSLAPSLKLNEPDSYAFKHYYEYGHALRRGCCAQSEPTISGERTNPSP